VTGASRRAAVAPVEQVDVRLLRRATAEEALAAGVL
jgi:hypothetical protein